MAAISFVALVVTSAEWTQAQTKLPMGAHVRLGTTDFLAGSSASAMAFSPDGKTIIWQGIDYGSHFTLRHWDVATAKEINRFIGDDFGDFPQQFSIFRVIDNNALLRTSANGLALTDLNTGEERVVTELARGKPSWISPNGKRILTYSTQGSWRKRTATARFVLWDVERSKKIRDFTHEFQNVPAKADAGARLTSVAFTPDGKTFATSWIYLASGPMLTARAGQVVSLWDVASGKETSLDAAAGYNLHFLEGGKTLACADGQNAGGARSTVDLHHSRMEIWDVAGGKKLREFESSVDWSGPLAFSPDGSLFASSGAEDTEGSDENAVAVWSTATGQQVRKFTGHRGKVRLLAFSPDGRLLASGIDDALYRENENSPTLAESILVWDLQK
ncbi:MAG: PD40 domain-containing protein [Planctomycetaceae bacterium]|nr:PD40 domain-containing protein [Planctomycetaceae bacterium]MCB9952079.1 PD40 domain-containing protein [Planctomycetaceae bacterium]